MESKILHLFAYDSELSFSQIKSKLKVRSNLLAYWLSKLVRKQILVKIDAKYSLAETSEHLVPYLSENKSTLPVILVFIGDKKHAFLYKREKRPYKNKLSLPGGRLLIGESIGEAAKRIMKIKFGISINKPQIKSLNLEHIKRNKKIIYSFLLIVVSAQAVEKLTLIDMKKEKQNVIKSDFNIIKSLNENNIKINEVMSRYQ